MELRKKHLVNDAVFLVDSASWLQPALTHHGLRFQHETHWNRNSVECVFRESKRRTNKFSNYFYHVKQTAVEPGFGHSPFGGINTKLNMTVSNLGHDCVRW